MAYYIHTNVLGTFVFDEGFKLKESISHKQVNMLEHDFLKWSEDEKKLVQKYSKNELFHIGFKDSKLEAVKLTQDPKKLESLSQFFKLKIQDFRQPNILLTKNAVKSSVNDDLFIIHAINNTNEIDKSLNILTKRLREWYELYLPEFSKSLGDHEKFTELILKRTKSELLQELNLKSNESMGAELGKEELVPIQNLAKSIQELYGLRKQHEKYLEIVLKRYCPNLQAIAGTMIGAKLLALAGSLKKLTLFPASTVQLLGAEKALFRHIKTGSRSPKYGILINHPLVLDAKRENKGKAARSLADKISIAVKVDYYKGEFIGDKLMGMLEKKFKKK